MFGLGPRRPPAQFGPECGAEVDGKTAEEGGHGGHHDLGRKRRREDFNSMSSLLEFLAGVCVPAVGGAKSHHP